MHVCVSVVAMATVGGEEETDAGVKEEERRRWSPSWISDYRSDPTHNTPA